MQRSNEEHLIKEGSDPVAIEVSEKTLIDFGGHWIGHYGAPFCFITGEKQGLL